MDTLIDLKDVILSILSLTNSPQSNLYWLYLLSTLILAVLIYLKRQSLRFSLSGVMRFCLPREIYRGRDIRRDIGMLLINTLLYSFFIAPYLISSASVANLSWWVLDALFGAVSFPLEGTPSRFALSVSVLLAADLGFFVSHYLQHKIAFLWEFHKVHHSSQTLNPLTAYRRHPVDIAIEGSVSGVLVGIAFGIFDYLSNGSIEMITILGINFGLFVFLLLGAHLQHSHIRISYGRMFNRIFISPVMHHIHHSNNPRHFDRNLGNIFSFWDALARTRYLPVVGEPLSLGLKDGEQQFYNSVLKLYFTPVVKIFQQCLNPNRNRLDLVSKTTKQS